MLRTIFSSEPGALLGRSCLAMRSGSRGSAAAGLAHRSARGDPANEPPLPGWTSGRSRPRAPPRSRSEIPRAGAACQPYESGAGRATTPHFAAGESNPRRPPPPAPHPRNRSTQKSSKQCRELGVDLTDRPQLLIRELAEQATIVVTMRCGDQWPIHPGKRYLGWNLSVPNDRRLEESAPPEIASVGESERSSTGSTPTD